MRDSINILDSNWLRALLMILVVDGVHLSVYFFSVPVLYVLYCMYVRACYANTVMLYILLLFYYKAIGIMRIFQLHNEQKVTKKAN